MNIRCILYEQYEISLDGNCLTLDRRFAMKYTKEQRLDIGQRIYDGEIILISIKNFKYPITQSDA